MPSDDDGGPEHSHADDDYEFLPIAYDWSVVAWVWCFRLFALVVAADAWLMHEVSPAVWLLSGILIGMALDRFVFWPTAVWLARRDGRSRPR